MIVIQHRYFAGPIGVALLGIVASVRAVGAPYEPNDSRSKKAVLAAGERLHVDSLSANLGRPDTLLGQYDPAYRTLKRSDDNGSPIGIGNGKASQLLGVPLEPNGSAYFRVTGWGVDEAEAFTGNHSQLGRYSVQFTVYDSAHVPRQPLIEYEDVVPGMIDNIWVDPDPTQIGGTVDVTINNVVGKGTGDSLDYFQFSGLPHNTAFTARIVAADFPSQLEALDALQHIWKPSGSSDPLPTVTGITDGSGNACVGVTGWGDSWDPISGFKGEHFQQGLYTLEVIPVPEPTGAILLGLGGMLLFAGRRFRRR